MVRYVGFIYLVPLVHWVDWVAHEPGGPLPGSDKNEGFARKANSQPPLKKGGCSLNR